MAMAGFNIPRAVRSWRPLAARRVAAPRMASSLAGRPALHSRDFHRLSSVSTLAARRFCTTALRHGITPDDKPVEPKPQVTDKKIITPADVTDEEFHRVANEYLETLLNHLESIQDTREDVDVEYADGVLTVSFGGHGTYVINKQPPNKQIWVSSPKSGPKRYDIVVLGDGQHEKEGTATSDWVYLRDNSTMNQLFLGELGIDLRMTPGYGE